MNVMFYRFVLIFVWLIVGAVMLVYQIVADDKRLFLDLGFANVSVGWLAIFFSGYHALLWWNLKRRAALRQEQDVITELRNRREREKPLPTIPEPDPTFMFNDPSPPNPDGEPPAKKG